MTTRDWWKRAFGSGLYPLVSISGSLAWRQRTPKECAFLRRVLGLRKGTEVLDVACGTGRHAIPLASGGISLTGADFSAPYLAEARRAARRAKVKVKFVRTDMRRLPFVDRFDAAYCLWTSFGYFPNAADDLRTLRGMRRALKPGGRVLIDTYNGPMFIRRFRLQERLGFATERWTMLEDGTFILEDPRLSADAKSFRSRWIFLRGTRRKEMISFTRNYDAARLKKIMRRAGFKIRRVYGSLAAAPYHPLRAPRVVVLAVRPKR